MPHSPQRIDALLPTVLKRAQERQTTLETIQRRWRTLVGKGLATHTAPVSFRRGRLVVMVESSGDSFALSYEHDRLLEQLRVRTQGRVKELVVRMGDVRRARGDAVPH